MLECHAESSLIVSNVGIYNFLKNFLSGIRAADPEANPGSAAVQIDGIRSSVCSVDWDSKSAAVYCRELGYRYSKVVTSSITSSSSKLPMIVTSIRCLGNESRLSDCVFVANTTADAGCSSYQEARVFCYRHAEGG